MIDVANHRRWKTVKVVQTYKHNSDQFKRGTASQIPSRSVLEAPYI